MSPTVSFVVPCYKLAHLLAECVDSILRQTYTDFEILIMDDCSPDNTAEVAESFTDARVRHVRNDPNLGHLQNYNKGIRLARGKYVWLISADDCLRQSYILERYVATLEANPRVGYVICPAIGLRKQGETGLLTYAYHGDHDHIFNGKQFLQKLFYENSVIAASGLVRKQCYEQISYFPLDMPFAGDWYLWCIFAAFYDVAYLSEPMVYYRLHELSMTTQINHNTPRLCAADDVLVLWRLKEFVDKSGDRSLRKAWIRAIANRYALDLYAHLIGRSNRMTQADIEASVRRYTQEATLQNKIFARTFIDVGDKFYSTGERSKAKEYYWCGIQLSNKQLMPLAKYWLLCAGPTGAALRKTYLTVRRASSAAR